MSLNGMPPFWRLKVLNQTGSTISFVSATLVRHVLFSTGTVSFEAAQSISLISAVGNGSSVSLGGIFSFTSNQWLLGVDGVLTVSGGGTTSGNLAVALTTSPDGVIWSDVADLVLSNHTPFAVVYFSTGATKSTPFIL